MSDEEDGRSGAVASVHALMMEESPMSCAVLAEAGVFHVMVIDPLGLWWDSVPEARRVLTADDRQVAHGVARYLESVEWAVRVLVVNGPEQFGRLHGVATGDLPIETLEIAAELVTPYDEQRLVADGTHPPRLDTLHRAHGLADLPDAVRDALPAVVRRLAAEGLRQAYDPASRLAGLRAAGQLVLARTAHAPQQGEGAVRMSPDSSLTVLECTQCLCEFWVEPDCREVAGIERYGAPPTISVVWHDDGVDLAVRLDEDDDCPCHGADVVLAWGSADARLLVDAAEQLGQPRGVVGPARLALGPELVIELSGDRHVAVRRSPTGEWEYGIWAGDVVDVTNFSSRGRAPEGRPLQHVGAAAVSADALARSLRLVLSRDGR